MRCRSPTMTRRAGPGSPGVATGCRRSRFRSPRRRRPSGTTASGGWRESVPRRLRRARAPAYGAAGRAWPRWTTSGSMQLSCSPTTGCCGRSVWPSDRGAQRANARAYNRFVADVCGDGEDRLFGVAHLLLHDPAWAVEEIRRVRAEGVRLAMIAPAPVDGKPLSHPDFDPVWAACSDEGVAPVFHVSEFESPLHPAWRQGELEDGEQPLRLHLLVAGPGGRAGRSHPARHTRTVPGAAYRRGRAHRRVGAQFPAPPRRRVGLLRPAPRRSVPAAGRAAVGLLLAPGPGGRAALRDAEPAGAQGGGPDLHVGQRLAPRRRRGRSPAAAERAAPVWARTRGPTSWGPTPSGCSGYERRPGGDRA